MKLKVSGEVNIEFIHKDERIYLINDRNEENKIDITGYVFKFAFENLENAYKEMIKDYTVIRATSTASFATGKLVYVPNKAL